MEIHFWNKFILSNKPLRLVISIIVLAVLTMWIYRRNKNMLIIFWGFILSMWAFSYSMHFGEVRHLGHLFIFMFACIWIIKMQTEIIPDKNFDLALTVLLASHAVAGFYAYSMDYIYPFTATESAAEYIREKGMESMPISGDEDGTMSIVAARLGKPVYLPACRCWETFIVWDDRRRNLLYDEEVILKAKDEADKEKKDFLMIFNRPVKELQRYKYLTHLEDFPVSIVPNEQCYLYILHAK